MRNLNDVYDRCGARKSAGVMDWLYGTGLFDRWKLGKGRNVSAVPGVGAAPGGLPGTVPGAPGQPGAAPARAGAAANGPPRLAEPA
jgi:hypothetical protein